MKLPAIRINPLGMLVVSFCAIFIVFVYASGWYGKNKVAINLKHLLAVSLTVAEMGGVKVREVRFSTDLQQSSKGKTKEGANDLLTAGDILSHRTMVIGLKESFPDLLIVSEEHEDSIIKPESLKLPDPQWEAVAKIVDNIEVPVNDIVVWIDPLDATQEYTENLLEYVTTMVCVAVRGKPVIGVIHQPFKNTTVWAWVGHGTSDSNFASASKLHSSIKPPNIIVSRTHKGKVEEVAKAAFGPETKVTSAGGAGYKSLQVAQGNSDAYVHVTLIKKWDTCAGNAILNAIGGEMTTLDGQPIDYGDPRNTENNKGLVASLHDHKKILGKLASLKN